MSPSFLKNALIATGIATPIAVLNALLLGMPVGIGIGLISAASVFAALHWIDRREQSVTSRLVSLGLPGGTYPVDPWIEFLTTMQWDNMLQVLAAAIKNLPNVNPKKVRVEGTRIEARTIPSFFSLYGELITADVVKTSFGTKVNLQSKPRLFTVAHDGQLDFQNVALILRSVNESCSLQIKRSNVEWSSVLPPADSGPL